MLILKWMTLKKILFSRRNEREVMIELRVKVKARNNESGLEGYCAPTLFIGVSREDAPTFPCLCICVPGRCLIKCSSQQSVQALSTDSTNWHGQAPPLIGPSFTIPNSTPCPALFLARFDIWFRDSVLSLLWQ